MYKLVAVEDRAGEIVPKIKISENVAKITNPGFKKVYRIFGAEGKCFADYICLRDEQMDGGPLELFDPEATWKRQVVTEYTYQELLQPIFVQGQLVYARPGLAEIKAYAAAQLDTLWDEVKRFDNPHNYYVDLSPKLWKLKNDLLMAGGQMEK